MIIKWLEITENGMTELDTLPKIHNSNQNLNIITKIRFAFGDIILAIDINITDLIHLYSASPKTLPIVYNEKVYLARTCSKPNPATEIRTQNT